MTKTAALVTCVVLALAAATARQSLASDDVRVVPGATVDSTLAGYELYAYPAEGPAPAWQHRVWFGVGVPVLPGFDLRGGRGREHVMLRLTPAVGASYRAPLGHGREVDVSVLAFVYDAKARFLDTTPPTTYDTSHTAFVLAGVQAAQPLGGGVSLAIGPVAHLRGAIDEGHGDGTLYTAAMLLNPTLRLSRHLGSRGVAVEVRSIAPMAVRAGVPAVVRLACSL